jgi:hypothetical protein
MPTGLSHILKSPKVALLAIVRSCVFYFMWDLIWWSIWSAKDHTVEPVPIFLRSMVPGIIAGISAFVLTSFLIGRKIEQPLSFTKTLSPRTITIDNRIYVLYTLS